MKYTISLNRHKIAKPTNVKKDQSKQKSYTDIHNSYVQIQDLSPVVVFFFFFLGSIVITYSTFWQEKYFHFPYSTKIQGNQNYIDKRLRQQISLLFLKEIMV